MKNFYDHIFLKTISKANTTVLTQDTLIQLVIFNDYLKLERFNRKLKKLSRCTFDEHVENLSNSLGDSSVYKKSFRYLYECALSFFIEHDGFLIHKNLSIIGSNNNKLSFDDLTIEIKVKISSFVSAQRTCLLNFLAMLTNEENSSHSTPLKWKASKTDLVELITALFEGGFIGLENGSCSKKELMKHFSNILGIDISSYKILLNKALTRENSATFIDKLKTIISAYYEKLLN